MIIRIGNKGFPSPLLPILDRLKSSPSSFQHQWPTSPPHRAHPLISSPVAAPQYAVFGKVTHGDDVLRQLESLQTKQEGMFVMVRGLRGFVGGARVAC